MQHATHASQAHSFEVPSLLPFLAGKVELVDTPEGPAHYRASLGIFTPAGLLGLDLVVDAQDSSDYGLVLADGTAVTCGELVDAYGSGSVDERDLVCAMLDVLAAYTHTGDDVMAAATVMARAMLDTRGGEGSAT